MNDLASLARLARKLQAEGRSAALLTVARIKGPSYRRPGARMLATAQGETWGTISGGCLEAEATRHAQQAIAAGAPAVLRFDTGADDPQGFGAGCGVAVHVLIQPGMLPLLSRIADLADARQMAVLATVVRADAGSGLAVGMSVLAGGDAAPWCPPGSEALAAEAARSGILNAHAETRILALAGGADVLIEQLPPPTRLVVLGDGHDVAPLVRAGASLGWEVAVVGRQPEAALLRRFPEAARACFLMHAEELPGRLPLDAHTAVVIMTHQFERDRALLHALRDAPCPYIGLLGARSRAERLLAAVEAPPARLHAPAGLDLGAETPEEIALAIVAEIMAALRERSGQPLHRLTGSLHRPVPDPAAV